MYECVYYTCALCVFVDHRSPIHEMYHRCVQLVQQELGHQPRREGVHLLSQGLSTVQQGKLQGEWMVTSVYAKWSVCGPFQLDSICVEFSTQCIL